MSNDRIPCAIINPEASPDSLEAKQPHVDNGTECYPKDGYINRDYMSREWNSLWTDSWLIAGVSSDLSKVGDYFLFDIGDESIIVTRTEDGVKAFYNVCSHRGAKLVWEERGSKKVFVCPFHSWSFHHTGELRRITDEETFHPDLVSHRPGLTPLACEEHAGIVKAKVGEHSQHDEAANDNVPEVTIKAQRAVRHPVFDQHGLEADEIGRNEGKANDGEVAGETQGHQFLVGDPGPVAVAEAVALLLILVRIGQIGQTAGRQFG